MVSLILANTYFASSYLGFWHAQIGFETTQIFLKDSLEHWVNDGLMAIFFLLIGLEVKRELYVGELSTLKNASLPFFAALGGVLTPALIHFTFNHGTPTQAGVGIPMATDIAFALGVLALLGNRIPLSLKIFLAALAIIDDLAAIVVIAVFYVGSFSLINFLLALGLLVVLLGLNRLGVRHLAIYLLIGLFVWYFMLRSGIHATIAGVLLAFVIPFGKGEASSPSHRLEHFLHKPVVFFILPIFALANTGIALGGNWLAGLVTYNSLGIFLGLLLGKPIGITLFSFLAIKVGLSQLPTGVTWKQIFGVSVLGGIGFTMSIFITLLAFDQADIIQSSKITILLTSLLAGLVGFFILQRVGIPKPQS